MQIISLRATLCVLAVPLGACDIGGGCTLSVEPGIRIEVRDRATGRFVTTTPRGAALQGKTVDSLEVSGFSADVPPRVATMDGWVPVGRYAVQLAADGYQGWDTAAVQVEEGECGILTSSFTAELEPIP